MKTESRLLSLAAWAALLWLPASGVKAQVPPGAPPAGPNPQAAPAAQHQPQLAQTSKLIGTRVVDRDNKYLGTIGDIVLTPDRNAIDYIVLSFGGFWSVPQKLFAVPWSQFQPVPGQKAFVLNTVTWKKLRNVPGFNREAWPAMVRDDWAAQARAGGPAIPTLEIQYRRVTKLTGMTVASDQNEVLGAITSFAVDTRTERVPYAILALSPKRPGVPQNLVAVPWPAIQVQPQAGLARLNASQQTLAAMSFTAGSFPDLANPRYSRQLYERFGVGPDWQALGYVPPEPATTPAGNAADQGGS